MHLAAGDTFELLHEDESDDESEAGDVDEILPLDADNVEA